MGDVLDSIDPRLCVACKAARGLCGIDPCPLLERVRSHLPRIQAPGRDVWGSSPPSLFVGRRGYPKVLVGPMLPPQHLPDMQARHLDAPRDWLGLAMADVIGLRSSLIRTTHAVRVDSAARPDSITQLSQELALAARPVDTEVRLRRIPTFSTAGVGDFAPPHGPTVEVEHARLGENPRIERPVERITSDTDLNAADGVRELVAAGTDLYQVEKILSAGMLGKQRRRRLVPTRWSITATDDVAGLDLIDRVETLPVLDHPMFHTGERFGNRFLILLLPRPWSFESIEAWREGSFWARGAGGAHWLVESDAEGHRGRKDYARTAGGYYATRLAVLEHLVRLGRQAAVVVLREIGDDYTTPLGVWVVRETARLALAGRALPFDDESAALRHIDRHARLPDWRGHAPALRTWLAQRRLPV